MWVVELLPNKSEGKHSIICFFFFFFLHFTHSEFSVCSVANSSSIIIFHEQKMNSSHVIAITNGFFLDFFFFFFCETDLIRLVSQYSHTTHEESSRVQFSLLLFSKNIPKISKMLHDAQLVRKRASKTCVFSTQNRKTKKTNLILNNPVEQNTLTCFFW